MKCLVTGGAGFIGSHLVDRLIILGYEVCVLDNLVSGTLENISHHGGDVTILQASITDTLDEAFKSGSFDVVFHLAALPQVQLSLKEPIKSHDVNVDGTLNILDACRRHGVRRVVFSSSSAIYGNQEAEILTESLSPNSLSPYALHKQMGEEYGSLYSRIYGLEVVSLRYFNVYGPRQNPEDAYASVIPKFCHLIRKGTSLVIHGDGEQTRDFIYVADVVAANIAAATSGSTDLAGSVVNIGSGVATSVNMVAQKLLMGNHDVIKPIHGEAVLEPRHSRADITRAKALLNWQPDTSLEEGIIITQQSYGSAV